MKPLISVIVPAWNEEKYIGRCLESLKKQTYLNYEIVVIDNNCIDKTVEIAKKFGARVVAEKKQGMIPARQRGFKEARGEIVVKTDADCVPKANWLETIYRTFQKNPKAVAVFGPVRFIDEGIITQSISYLFILWMIFSTRILMGHYQLIGGNSAIRREVIKKIKPHLNDKQVHEDIDLSCHVNCYGKIVYKRSIVVDTSGRRFVYNPFAFVEYVHRFFKTYFLHHPSHKWHKVS